MPSVHDQVSAQFAAFERRGRGWQVFPEPVTPEPPFQPFTGYSFAPVIDDGRKVTVGSSLLSDLVRWLGKPPAPEPAVIEAPKEPEPTPLYRSELVELRSVLPAGLDIPREAFGTFLTHLHACAEPLAFELVGTHHEIAAQFAMHPYDAPLVRRQLAAYFPEAAFVPANNTLDTFANPEGEFAVVEFGLEREFFHPLATGKLDPFIGIIGALSELKENECGLYQVIFQPCRERWAESLLRSVSDSGGSAIFANRPQYVALAKEKTARPLYAAVVRIAAKSDSFEGAWDILRHLAGSLRVFANPGGNELIPLHNREYPIVEHLEDVLCRQSRRSGMLLNAEELIGFVHLPSASVKSSRFARQAVKTKAAPGIALNAGGLYLGDNLHSGVTRKVSVSPDQRSQHCHVVGASGTGKSTFLFNLIEQDVKNGEGLAVLDPHGDLIDRILGIIPEHRIDDVVLLDPADEEYSVGFNILSAHSDLEKTLLASDLISVFERLSSSWGDQLASVLRNAILAFLESRQGGTLNELRRFLIDSEYRNTFLQTVSDPDIVYYWRKAFPQLTGNRSIGPVLTRLDAFLAPKPIRYMVSQQANRIDFAEIMGTGKILLARLASGAIGKENSYLLGSLLMAKFQQTAMSRQSQAAAERRNFWLYVDEFQNFITPSMAEILAESRKYRVGLILAHQELRQLEKNRDVASAVMSHCYTRVVFRVSDSDARSLEQGFSAFETRDFQNLGTGQAIARLERSNFDFNLSIPLPEPVDPTLAKETRERAVAASRAKYAVPRTEVEAALQAKAGAEPHREKPKQTPEVKPEHSHTEPASVPIQPVQPPPEPADRELQAAIQERIRQAAEAIGYEAKLEHVILDGAGRTDITLIRGSLTVACEITVTTTIDHEAANVAKCLRGGFGHVAVICANKRKLDKIRELVTKSILPAELAKVGFYLPNEFVEQLYVWTEEAPEVPKGKSPPKQTIRFGKNGIGEEERQRKEGAMLKNIAAAMKRPKNES